MNSSNAAFTFKTLIRVDKVSLKGPGVLILTGPSSCGKGQVAHAICRLLSLDSKNHLSMGEILRQTVALARADQLPHFIHERLSEHFQKTLADPTDDSLLKKMTLHLPMMSKYFQMPLDLENVTAFLWLEYCTFNGLLIPDLWTELLIEYHIDFLVRSNPEETFILDGYPRTIDAARHLINYLKKIKLPVLKVLHLSISREEMLRRAMNRGREDDEINSLISRFEFYVEKVHPSVDYLKEVLGSDSIALIDAHQPVYMQNEKGETVLDIKKSILRICVSTLRALGVPRIVITDLIENYEVQS